MHLWILCIGLRPLDGPPAVIRTDPAPGFAALANDAVLAKYRLTIELGRVKNVNKNPVAEKAVRELECELLHQQPTGGTVTQLVLSVATANLNTRIRNKGFSARELWTQRDQFTNEQLPLTDYNLIRQQHALRNANHAHSQLTPLSLLSLLLLLLLLLLSMIYTCRSQFANQKCWSDFTQFIVSALKLNVSTFINPIFYLYRSRITNQLVWYDFTLFIVSITTLCYVYICLGVLYGDLFYSLT